MTHDRCGYRISFVRLPVLATDWSGHIAHPDGLPCRPCQQSGGQPTQPPFVFEDSLGTLIRLRFKYLAI